MIDGRVYAINRARMESAHAQQTSGLVSEHAAREGQLSSQLSAARSENVNARTDIVLLEREIAELRQLISQVLSDLETSLSVSPADIASWRTKMDAIKKRSVENPSPKKRRQKSR